MNFKLDLVCCSVWGEYLGFPLLQVTNTTNIPVQLLYYIYYSCIHSAHDHIREKLEVANLISLAVFFFQESDKGLLSDLAGPTNDGNLFSASSNGICVTSSMWLLFVLHKEKA